MNEERTSILDMAMGAIKERADYEMARIIDQKFAAQAPCFSYGVSGDTTGFR